MKTKIALLLCFMIILSCLVSCENSPETSNISDVNSSANQSDAISQSSEEDSSTEESQEIISEIPETILYFTGEYLSPDWMIVPPSNKGLNEPLNEPFGVGLKAYLRENQDTLDKSNTYFYVGITLADENITDEEELSAKNERMLKQVGFIPTDEPYFKKSYVYGMFPEEVWTMTSEELKAIHDEVIQPIYIEHAKNLVPGMDVSEYYDCGMLTKFCFDQTGYITIDGLTELVDNYTGVAVTWLPAPDDRERLLTYLANYKIED